MAGLVRLSVEDFAGYCAGDSLSDASIEDQLRHLEEPECFELDSEGSKPGRDSSEDEDGDRIEAIFFGAYCQHRCPLHLNNLAFHCYKCLCLVCFCQVNLCHCH